MKNETSDLPRCKKCGYSAKRVLQGVEERIVLALMKEADIQKQGGYGRVHQCIHYNIIPIVRREFRIEREVK